MAGFLEVVVFSAFREAAADFLKWNMEFWFFLMEI